MARRSPSDGAATLAGCIIFGAIFIVFAVIAVLAIGWAWNVVT